MSQLRGSMRAERRSPRTIRGVSPRTRRRYRERQNRAAGKGWEHVLGALKLEQVTAGSRLRLDTPPVPHGGRRTFHLSRSYFNRFWDIFISAPEVLQLFSRSSSVQRGRNHDLLKLLKILTNPEILDYLHTVEVTGSNPVSPTISGPVAQHG